MLALAIGRFGRGGTGLAGRQSRRVQAVLLYRDDAT